MLVMNIHICTKNDFFFVAKGYRNPKWKIGVKEEENYPPFSNHIMATNGLTTNQILYNMFFWRTWFSMLQRVTNFYLQLKIYGCDVWFCGRVGMYSFHPIAKWRLKCSQIWWRKLGRYVSSQPLHLVLFVHVRLIFGCFVWALISLLLLWASSTLHGSLVMWQLGFLRCITLQVQQWQTR
jgi:hypothetical protein